MLIRVCGMHFDILHLFEAYLPQLAGGEKACDSTEVAVWRSAIASTFDEVTNDSTELDVAAEAFRETFFYALHQATSHRHAISVDLYEQTRYPNTYPKVFVHLEQNQRQIDEMKAFLEADYVQLVRQSRARAFRSYLEAAKWYEFDLCLMDRLLRIANEWLR